jgi:hypothetical protein
MNSNEVLDIDGVMHQINEVAQEDWDVRLNQASPQDWDKASHKQVGGDHYKDFPIQPIKFVVANDLGFCESNAIKYICRHHAKGGVQDIDKAIHYLELLKEHKYEC